MTKTINVKLPINVSEDVKYLFEPFLTYQLEQVKVKNLKNIFVTYSGFCMNDKGLIKESHHDQPHQFNDYLNEAAGYYYDTIEHPENLIVLDDCNTYLVIHHPWYNYYHWICECVFRAWMVKHKKDDMVLVLPDYYQHSDFIMSSLEPFGFTSIFFIPPGKSLMVRNLCLPQIKQKVDSYDYKKIKQIKNYYLNYVLKTKGIAKDLGERIYISRRKAQRKKVQNELEVESILIKYGFNVINNEDYDFFEQVAIYSNAKYLVSMHGSGLTNMLFMKNGASILEFHKNLTNDKDWHSKAFWYMAEALGYKYYQQICEPTHLQDNYFNANFIVDIEVLEKNLSLMFQS